MLLLRQGLRCLMGAVIALMSLSVQAQQAQITVLAAASLTEAFQEIAYRFEQTHATTVILSFGASDMLAQQIIHGAPAHVVATADQVAMDKVAHANRLVADSRINFATNILALITAASAPDSLRRIEDLVSKQVKRIAVANPDSVPAGRYAKQALENAGLWSSVQSRLVFGQHVRQVLDYVARGEVDAGFVFLTDAQQRSDQVEVMTRISLPEDAHYPIALTPLGEDVDAAHAFIEFVSAGMGQSILQQYGFLSP